MGYILWKNKWHYFLDPESDWRKAQGDLWRPNVKFEKNNSDEQWHLAAYGRKETKQQKRFRISLAAQFIWKEYETRTKNRSDAVARKQ